MSTSNIKKLAVAFAAVATLGATSCKNITQREFALRTTMGSVGKVYEQGAGLAWFVPLFQSVHVYDLYMQSFKIEAASAHFRTSDNQEILGGYDVQYEIDPKVGDPKEMFTTFNDNVENLVKQQAKSVAVAVLGRESSVNLTGKIEEIQQTIREKLQAELTAQKVPVNIKSVLSDGIGLSSTANQKLEGIMMEQQRAKLLDLRLANAQKAKGVETAEAEATASGIDVFRQKGLSEDGALKAYFLQLAEKDGHVNAPFTPGIFNGSKQAVSVVAPK